MEARSSELRAPALSRGTWLLTAVGVFAVTLSAFVAAGAALPVLPRFVRGPVHAGDLAVGVVIGAFSVSAIVVRPWAGHLADRRGRKPAVLGGTLLTGLAGTLLLTSASLPMVLASRLVMGAGEGLLFTAGSAWIVDLAPADRQGQTIGLFGLSVWGGMALGPLIGDQLLRLAGYDAVWVMMALVPLAGGLVAWRLTETRRPPNSALAGPLIPRAVLAPGAALALANAGYATMAAFVVLALAHRGIGHGALVFTAYAVAVVGSRLLLGRLPDRIGARRSAVLAGLAEAAGLAVIAEAGSWPVAVAGGVVMGAGFSLLYPALALAVVQRTGEHARGRALGGFTAFFDLGMGVGAPAAGALAALGGYALAFWVATSAALGAALVAWYLLPGR
ncbi:MAG TPA: MFS transporter [Solirubrobacteraceae bacterium]|nr:MFS transporter [Solirubrobacteraceae bacterium]